MRPVALTAVLLALTAIVLVAVSPVRQGLQEAVDSARSGGTRLSPARLEQAAAQHPTDATAWLGYAELAAGLEAIPSLSSGAAGIPATEAYGKALAADPRSPAVHLRAALSHLAAAGKLLRPEAVGTQGPLPSRTPAEAANLQAARKLLGECRTLAPANAACDYFLAWTLFADGKDAEAYAVLREALVKGDWTLYDGEVAAAALRLGRDARLRGLTNAIYVSSILSATQFPRFAEFRELARLLAGLGGQLAGSGRHEQAVLCFESAVHLGRLARVHAHSMIDGLVGVAVTQAVAGPFVSGAEREQLKASAGQGSEGKSRVDGLRTTRFADYLRSHGRVDLADLYVSEVAAGVAWRADAQRGISGQMSALIAGLAGGGTMNAAAVWAAAVGLVLVGVVVGIVSLILRFWLDPRPFDAWSIGPWLALLAALLVPAQIVATVGTAAAKQAGGHAWVIAGPGALIAAVVGLVAWLTTAITTSLRRRASQVAAERPSRGRTVLAGLRALLPPTLAALLLLSALALWPVHRNIEHVTRQQETIMTQGEVQYWAIGSGDARRPTSPRQ